ncbi:hypothetical protein BD289DRAFT_217930 [Coniella lustricola]|uniref:Uncharacterized protein n=1 Tax=Coniella lustricola TaxID=2025994 RepID=A0A2T2ZRZ7_9PEZI|nr:hypothetical protein BD289DRAFT_217930 [Coniella lustricola]
MILQVLADAGNVLDDGDVQLLQLVLGAQPRQQQQARGVDGAGAQDGLGAGVDGAARAVAQGQVDAGDGVVVDVDARDPGVGQDGQVGAVLLAAQDGVDVGDRGRGAVVVVGVVRDVEEADALGQGARLCDFLVVVGDDGDVHGVAAGEHPVLAQLVAVARVHGLDRVAQLVHEAHEVGERPAGGAERLPDLEVVLKGAERDEGVVRRAAAQDLGARVADVRVACGGRAEREYCDWDFFLVFVFVSGGNISTCGGGEGGGGGGDSRGQARNTPTPITTAITTTSTMTSGKGNKKKRKRKRERGRRDRKKKPSLPMGCSVVG